MATLAERVDDVRAVMDAAGSERAILYGVSESGPLHCLFAATYPERVSALVLYAAYASEVRKPDYPWPPTAEAFFANLDTRARTVHETWGSDAETVTLINDMGPSAVGDSAFRAWFSTFLRLGASPGAAIALERMDGMIDVRHILPAIRVPTLVVHRRDVHETVTERGRYVAAHIPGAQLVELPGKDYLPFVGDVDALVDEIEAFVTGTRPVAVLEHVLATVLVCEIADPATRALALGDRIWSDLQDRFQGLARRALDDFRGNVLDLAGDRVAATFDGPARAIRCARSVAGAARGLGIPTRTGVHTGECEVRDERVSGVAVTLAAWVAGQAAPDEMLVSSTVKDLVAGAELRFADRGARTLPGAPDEWRLFAVLPDAPVDAEISLRVGPTLPAHPAETLTRREREVLPLVARGLSNRQIADALSIGERTAESHVASILAKSGLSSRAQIAAGVSAADDRAGVSPPE